MQPTRHQFFALLRGDTTTEEIIAKRAFRAKARALGRRQNELEDMLDALPLNEFIAIKRDYATLFTKLAGVVNSIDSKVYPHEWEARKWAYQKVWKRRVEVNPKLPSVYQSRKARRQEEARIARSQGKAKNR